VIALIHERLADSIDLILQSKHAHWNVKGPCFIALHELFDKIAEEAQEYADLIAERIAQLGGSPDGTLQGTLSRTTLPSYRIQAVSGHEHLMTLCAAFAAYGEAARCTIDKAYEVNDVDTADIFTEISRSVDKNLWLLEAHVQAKS
jgi:starvation-inducible DNA-binding protein